MSASRWKCGQRTATESAVDRGLIGREAAAKLLAKYGVPMTAASKVHRGEPVKGPTQGKLV